MPLGLQAWWVLPLFISAALGFGLGHRDLAARLLPKPGLPPVTLGAAGGGVIAFVFSYGSSGFVQAWPLAALGVYGLVWLVGVGWVAASARRVLVLHSLGAAIAGPAAEIAISHSGAFAYAHPDLFGVPIWLPGIYLNVGLASHLIDRHLQGRQRS